MTEDDTVTDTAALDVETRWVLNPIQWDFVHSPARFSFYVGGVGAGKTTAGAARAILRAVEQPGSLGLIGAPTYTMLRDTTAQTFLALLPEQAIASYTRGEGHLRLRNGSRILLRSLDQPDRVRGLNLAWFWLDEAPLCGYYAWQMLKARLRQRGYEPAGWATGTPHGRDGYAHDFELAPRPNHALYRASTYTNAHNLPADYITDLGYTGALAQQEVFGLFVAFAGLVYAFDASPQGHVREPSYPDAERAEARTRSTQREEREKDEKLSAPSALKTPYFARVIGGIDWGYTNPAAAAVFGLDGDDRAWQLDEFYQRRAALEETLLPALLDLTRRYSVETWYCGPDEPEHIAALRAALADVGLRARVVKADNAVRPGIQTITRLLAHRPDGTRGLYVAPRCVQTIAEYLSYQYPSAEAETHTPSEQPVKQHDHLMDATRYALHTALSRRRATAAYLADMQRRGQQ